MLLDLAERVRKDRSLPLLYWLALALFVAYLCIAMALPVVPVFVTVRLGYGNGLAGLAVGSRSRPPSSPGDWPAGLPIRRAAVAAWYWACWLMQPPG